MRALIYKVCLLLTLEFAVGEADSVSFVSPAQKRKKCRDNSLVTSQRSGLREI